MARRMAPATASLVMLLGLLPAGCTVSSEQPIIDGQDVQVTFLHTSDIHSRLLPYNLKVAVTDGMLGLKQDRGPFGGIARLAALVKQERRDQQRLVHVDTGDVFQGAPIFNAFSGEVEFRAMSQLEVDSFVIGNHEYDNGVLNLVGKARQFASFPILGANYTMGDPNFPGTYPNAEIALPYTIINARGLRVGIIGLASMGGSSSGGSAKGIMHTRDRDAVQDYVDFLRPIVDLVVVASHAGLYEDLEILPRVEGVDILFGGHLHVAFQAPKSIYDCDIGYLEAQRKEYICGSLNYSRIEQECSSKNGCLQKSAAEAAQCLATCKQNAPTECLAREELYSWKSRAEEIDRDIAFLKKRGCHPRSVLVMHSGAFLKFMGKLEVTLRQCHRLEAKTTCARWGISETGQRTCQQWTARRCVGNSQASNDWEIVGFQHRLVPVDNQITEDPQMRYLMQPYVLELNRQQQLAEVLAFTRTSIKRFSSIGAGDSALGNLVAESMLSRPQVWAEMAITNTLGIRTDLLPGALDTEQMYNVFPFENSITVMYLTGADIQELMDFVAARSASRGCKAQAQVAGVTATLNCKGCVGNGGNPCGKANYNGAPCAQKVTIGGTGKACAVDTDCVDERGVRTGEICSDQVHPVPSGDKKYRCGVPLSCARVYRLAANDYIAYGGSGFQVLARNTTQQNLKLSLRDATVDYLLRMPACSYAPQTVEQITQGEVSRRVLTADELAKLTELESLIVEDTSVDKTKQNLSLVNAAYSQFVAGLKARKAASSTDKQTATGLANYLACIEEQKEKPDGFTAEVCVGLTCMQLASCTPTQGLNIELCKARGRLRGAQRCLSLPCITAQEDFRLKLIAESASGSPDTDDPGTY